MELLVQEDRLLSKMYLDLISKNPNVPKTDIMEVVFNSEVLEDSYMESLFLEKLEEVES